MNDTFLQLHLNFAQLEPYLLIRVQSLFLKTEALDLIEIQSSFEGDHVVRCHSSNGGV